MTMANFDLCKDCKGYCLMHIFTAGITLMKRFNADEAIERE